MKKQLTSVLSIIFLSLLVNINFAFGQESNNEKVQVLTKNEFNLIRHLLSCQTLCYTIGSQNTERSEIYAYMQKGKTWYNYAYENYIAIQSERQEMEFASSENIATLLNFYSEYYYNTEFAQSSEATLALPIVSSVIQTVIIPDLVNN